MRRATVSFTLVFCFKQKTAYEMRISDWSSDVCSSDLRPGLLVADHHLQFVAGTGRGHLLHELRVQVGIGERHAAGQQAGGDGGNTEGLALCWEDRKSTRLHSSHYCASRMPSSA